MGCAENWFSASLTDAEFNFIARSFACQSALLSLVPSDGGILG
jgi:hypothetical protein